MSGISKVVYKGSTLIDLTSDTVNASHLATGYTAHSADGSLITGTMSSEQGTQITVELLSATSNTTYTAPTGKAYSPVVVNVPTVTITQSGSNLSIV